MTVKTWQLGPEGADQRTTKHLNTPRRRQWRTSKVDPLDFAICFRTALLTTPAAAADWQGFRALAALKLVSSPPYLTRELSTPGDHSIPTGWQETSA
jgi:hypothetical protein